MKRLFVLFLVLIAFFVPAAGLQAGEMNRELLLEDLLFAKFFPDISRAMVVHYGESKQFMCPRIVDLKKRWSGSYLFEVTLEVETFEGPHNPPHDLVTITFRNDERGWQVKQFTAKRLARGEHRHPPCRDPL